MEKRGLALCLSLTLFFSGGAAVKIQSSTAASVATKSNASLDSDRPVAENPMQVSGLFPGTPQEETFFIDNAAYGWYDPHLHESGAVNMHGMMMCTPEADGLMRQLFATAVWKAAMDSAMFQARKHTVASDSADRELLYSILARGNTQCPPPSRAGQNPPSLFQALCTELESFKAELYRATSRALLDKVQSLVYSSKMGRTTDGTGALMPLMKCLEDTPEGDTESRLRILTHLLTANPLLDFDSVYVTRAMLRKGEHSAEFFRLTVTELIDSHTAYTQFSTPISKVPSELVDQAEKGGDKYGIHFYGSPVRKDNLVMGWMPMFLGSCLACSPEGTVTVSTRVTGPSGGNMVGTKRSATSCTSWVDDKKVGFNQAMKKLRQGPDLHGVDFASPELFTFNQDDGEYGGRTRFLKVVDGMLEITKSHGLKPDGTPVRRMVVHIHVGEGFGLFDKEAIYTEGMQEPSASMAEGAAEPYESYKDRLFGMRPEKYRELCMEAVKPRVFDSRGFFPTFTVGDAEAEECPERYSREQLERVGTHRLKHGRSIIGTRRCYPGEPLHYENARKNIDTLLDLVEYVRGELVPHGLDDYLRIQFGHATHTTLKQATRMANLKVMVDVDLSSNIATGALAWTDRLLAQETLFVTRGDQNTYAHAGRSQVVSPTSGVAEVFARHALLKLLLAGVEVTMGTDGIGIEHSGMVQDYHVAEAVVTAYHTRGFACSWMLFFGLSVSGLCAEMGQLYLIFGPASISAEEILRAQHSQWMWVHSGSPPK